MKSVLTAAVIAVVCFGAGYLLRPQPPAVPPPPTKADTTYVSLPLYEARQELIFTPGPKVWTTDTIQVVYERIVTDTQYVGWDLPPMWCVDRLRAPTSPGDTLNVSLVMVRSDSASGVHLGRRIDRLWADGYLRALEIVGEDLRVDYTPFATRSNGSFWRWMERAGFFAGGVAICKL